MHRIGGAFRVSFGPFLGVFLTHTTSMTLRIRQEMVSNDPPKSIHPLCNTPSQVGGAGSAAGYNHITVADHWRMRYRP